MWPYLIIVGAVGGVTAGVTMLEDYLYPAPPPPPAPPVPRGGYAGGVTDPGAVDDVVGRQGAQWRANNDQFFRALPEARLPDAPNLGLYAAAAAGLLAGAALLLNKRGS